MIWTLLTALALATVFCLFLTNIGYSLRFWGERMDRALLLTTTGLGCATGLALLQCLGVLWGCLGVVALFVGVLYGLRWLDRRLR